MPFRIFSAPQSTPDPEGTPLRWQLFVACDANYVAATDENGRTIAEASEDGGFVIRYVKGVRRFPAVDVWDTWWLVTTGGPLEMPVYVRLSGNRPTHSGTVTVSRGGGGGVEVVKGKSKKTNELQLRASYNGRQLPPWIRKLLKKR